MGASITASDVRLRYGPRHSHVMGVKRKTVVPASRFSHIFFTSHEDDGVDVEIDIGLSIVIKYRYMGKWHKPKEPITLKLAVERLIIK